MKYLRYENFCIVEMSILSYFKPKDGLPDPKGSLSSILPSQAIALANKEVEKVISEKDDTKKRGATATEYRSVALWGTRTLVVCTQNFVVKNFPLLKNLRRTRSQTKIF